MEMLEINAENTDYSGESYPEFWRILVNLYNGSPLPGSLIQLYDSCITSSTTNQTLLPTELHYTRCKIQKIRKHLTTMKRKRKLISTSDHKLKSNKMYIYLSAATEKLSFLTDQK